MSIDSDARLHYRSSLSGIVKAFTAWINRFHQQTIPICKIIVSFAIQVTNILPMSKIPNYHQSALVQVLSATAIFSLFPVAALAHVSEQGFVLLLPTGTYILSGVAAVALSVLIIGFLPARVGSLVFKSFTLFRCQLPEWQTLTSLASTCFLALLMLIGVYGPHDPLTNALPLFIWTIWWVAFFIVQGLVGDIWRWVNPWSGVYRLLRGDQDERGLLELPKWAGSWPAVVGYFAFSAFFLADLAPDNPDRLAWFVAGYWVYTLVAMVLFGAKPWLTRGECFSVLLHHYARLSAFSCRDKNFRIGLPGWQHLRKPALSLSGGIFILMILATGTFDGVNETFWWLGLIGINPLEFPGRSAVVWPTLAGLALSNLALPLVFAATLKLGLVLAGETGRFRESFGRLSRAILPIALGYHFAHYFTSFLVNGQYALAAASDPLAKGSDYLGLGTYYVTTGFLNSHTSVKLIWLSQAFAIVIGHLLAILLSHAIAIEMFGNNRKAVLSQIPLALFMIAYTLFGLWLLAAPRGA